jgi:hypothetical protein
MKAIEEDPTQLNFFLSLNNDKAEELIAYKMILVYLARDESDVVWKLCCIESHQEPLKLNHKDYRESPSNLLIEWETGETTMEPLPLIAKGDPLTCTLYAKEHSLLDKLGRKIAKQEKTFSQVINQAKLCSFMTAP